MKSLTFREGNTTKHFIRRAGKYNYSSRWVNDRNLILKIRDLSEWRRTNYVLDIAVGTGKIAAAFHGKVKRVVGIDSCREMIEQSRGRADEIILGLAEKMPFKNDSFDICVCRQGLQFMEVNAVLEQIYRILKPEGRLVLCHLAAYGENDKETTFLIQRLRNPARKNFFLAENLIDAVKANGFSGIESFEYITKETVNKWADNGAINMKKIQEIIKIYKNAPAYFKARHNIIFAGKDIFDSMKMVIIKAKK